MWLFDFSMNTIFFAALDLLLSAGRTNKNVRLFPRDRTKYFIIFSQVAILLLKKNVIERIIAETKPETARLAQLEDRALSQYAAELN